MTTVNITLDVQKDLSLQGELSIPQKANGIILFAHGSGSGRSSPRNQYVAKYLNKDSLATLLVDLLTQQEEDIDTKTQEMIQSSRTRMPGIVLNKFNITLLSERLATTTDWILQNQDTNDLMVGYFGASTGTAAALVAAAQRPHYVKAIVSRSGRPDLAGNEYLVKIKVPTLLIVGGSDYKKVIDWNKDALNELGTEKKKLVVIPNATHLFEEADTLDEVSRLASGWFRCYFQIEQHNMKHEI
jgi:putative phosphoribosyl transferase